MTTTCRAVKVGLSVRGYAVDSTCNHMDEALALHAFHRHPLPRWSDWLNGETLW
jgi:hypothetical protein